MNLTRSLHRGRCELPPLDVRLVALEEGVVAVVLRKGGHLVKRTDLKKQN